MPQSAFAAHESRARLTERSLGRRRLLAIGAAVPVTVVIAKASGAFTAPGTPLLAGAFTAPGTLSGHAYYFC